jgi:hypothetical protein
MAGRAKGLLVSDEECIALLAHLSPHIVDWSTLWWGAQSVQVAALGHPWQTVPYGAGLVMRLNAALQPYRYTMRRKIRKAFGL